MSSKKIHVKDLFKSAHEEGDLSNRSLKTLTVHADIGAQIQAGLGVAPDDVPASEVVLVTQMPDDSGSIRFSGNAGVVRDGHNLVLEALEQSKQMADVLAHTRYLNGKVLFPYRSLKDAVRMNEKNYDPILTTPLYDQTVVVLGTVIAKTKEFEESGVPVRSVTLILTDGADAGSCRQTPDSVRSVVEDMERCENHIIAAMGIDDGTTDFRKVFKEMGIRDEWILTPGNSSSEIRSAFQIFSQSAVRTASQTTAAFSQMGGFAVN